MIFVTVGSTDFDALVAKMDELAPQLGTEVVMQIGLGTYTPSHARYFRFAPSLDNWYDEADMIVGHGGLGTIVEALERGKKLVCVVNPTTYDRHQEHLLQLFTAQNCLLWCKDLEQLADAIQQARETTFSPYQPPDCHIHERIAQYLHRASPSNTTVRSL
jgi:beta-1,4-N-acetylglucosaminyltransferase